MRDAAAVREQVEDALRARMLGALSPRTRVQPERTPCGNAAVDELLGGGLANGVVTEFVGRDGSGRTTAAMACVAAVMSGGKVCAWIDATDALDPESAAANGVDLERLLWVRCGSQEPSVAESAVVDPPRIYGSIRGFSGEPRHTGGGSPHPRSEGRDMPEAIGAMLHAHVGLYDRQVRREKRGVGTPGAPNRTWTRNSGPREEQVNSDRLPPRRGENLSFIPRCAEMQLQRVISGSPGDRMTLRPASLAGMPKNTSPWKALDQALRATDLLLQGGGFSTIVLDFGSVPPEFVWRIPSATWFRFRTACERTRVSLILLTQHPCARSSAELVVRMQSGIMEAEGKVMTGIRYRASTERSRTLGDNVVPIRKPPQSERRGQWFSKGAWVQSG